MKKNSLGVLVSFIVLLIVFILFKNWNSGERNFITETEPEKTAHLYKNPAVSIAKIHLKIFYAVPKDKTDSVYAGFSSFLKKYLDDAVRFHRSQFREYSAFTYDVYPEPVFMDEESLFYNTTDTNHGNPEGLKNLVPEIERKMAAFLKHEKDEFLVIGIVYEGVGASGAESAFLLSREFLSEEQYRLIAATLLYHEFGHALGLPDQYDIATGAPYSNDIMGGGREKPIEVNYIDRELLREMGIVE